MTDTVDDNHEIPPALDTDSLKIVKKLRTKLKLFLELAAGRWGSEPSITGYNVGVSLTIAFKRGTEIHDSDRIVVEARRTSSPQISRHAGVLGDLTRGDMRVRIHRRLRTLVSEESLGRLPADLADERIACTAATAVEFEILAGFGVEIGDIGLHREMNHTAAPSKKTIAPTCPGVVATNFSIIEASRRLMLVG